MILSDALPVQFYLAGQETYNESVSHGGVIEEFCFFQEWGCDDEIKIMFADDSGEEFSLVITDEDGAIIDQIAITKSDLVGDNVLPALADFTNDGSSGTAWTTGSTPSVTMSGGPATSKELEKSGSWRPGIYRLTRDVSRVGSINGFFRFKKGGTVILSTSINSDGSTDLTLPDDGEDFAADEVNFIATHFSGSTSFTINSATLSTLTYSHNITVIPNGIGVCGKKFRLAIYDSDDTMLARTDLMYAGDDIQENVSVRYKGFKPYAGIPWTGDESPMTYRIPGVFFKERAKTTTTSLELSNSKFITTSSMIMKKRKFSIQDCPDDFHFKNELIFNHGVVGQVIIDGVEWKRDSGDNYEKNEDDRPDEQPMAPAEILLTRKDWVKRNVI